MKRRLIWTRAKHRDGLERPHFVATETVAVTPAQGIAKAAVANVFCPCRVTPKRNKEERRTHVDNQQTTGDGETLARARIIPKK
jgi:hypothetical protein